jgi:hypothetical protein
MTRAGVKVNFFFLTWLVGSKLQSKHCDLTKKKIKGHNLSGPETGKWFLWFMYNLTCWVKFVIFSIIEPNYKYKLGTLILITHFINKKLILKA